MKTVIRWVVALRPEANPLIERFSLEPLKGVRSPFPIYGDANGQHELIISGMGKSNAAAATAFLAAVRPHSDGCSGWVNIGVAGGGAESYGEIGLASRVTDASSGRSWYPAATWPRKFDLPRVSVLSLDQPSHDYPETSTRFEMEAAGFYPTALKFGSVETAHVIKVVSDDPDHPLHDLTKSSIQGLIENQMGSLEKWMSAFHEVLIAEAQVRADPPDFSRILEAFHFSETRKHQLRRLLQQRAARGIPEIEGVAQLVAECRDAAECLQFLKRDLNWEE